MMEIGRERLERRQRLRVLVRNAVDRWNDRRQVMHLGDRINLTAEITEAIMSNEALNA